MATALVFQTDSPRLTTFIYQEPLNTSTVYCHTPQVNQLTALLLAHGIHHIVVCPGSRNATIVHNLHECGLPFTLHPVTDERSAGFVALGLSLALQAPTAVCVTSGSALLGCIPAAAEAYYRHLPLLVISADRPMQWIGQYDGQTLPQNGALAPYCPTYQLCVTHNAQDEWYNNRSINEAILSLQRGEGGPAHINVPIEEPMFQFSVPDLPQERVIREIRPNYVSPLPAEILEEIQGARLPAVIIGQYEKGDIRAEIDTLERQGQLLILPEILSDVKGSFRMNILDTLDEDNETMRPDVILHIGGNFVHKRFKQLLRNHDCRVIRIGMDQEMPDTFCHLDTVLPIPTQPVLHQLAEALPHKHTGVMLAQQLYEKAIQQKTADQPLSDNLTQQLTLASLYQILQAQGTSFTLHLANSRTVRVAGNVFPSGEQQIYGNRGTNGIEGSLSTAVGYALGMWGLSIAIIGDLSFFYDANALWNMQLPADLRILLLNNGRGGIFDHLPGLSQSPARDELIAAGHQDFSAEGIAQTFHVGYHCIHEVGEMNQVIEEWLKPAEQAQILEVFTLD